MSQFKEDDNHKKAFAILFDSFQIESKFKESIKGKIAHFNVKDREEQRIASMFDSLRDIGNHFMNTQVSAISCIAIAKSSQEALGMQMGLLDIIPKGVAICPTCLDRAIVLAEENLTILKDLKEATKQYATNS